jgi:hypothetical protein
VNTTRFDRLTRELAAGTSRRRVLKMFAGAAVALGATAVISPTSRAAACGDPGAECTVNDDCCQGFYCNFDGVCAGAAECAGAGGGCDADEACCGRLTCSEEDRTCGGPSAGCAGAGESCDTDDACCGRSICRDDGTCGGPSAGSGCAADGDCATDEICCGGACAAIACCIEDDDPNARCAAGTSCFEGVCDPIGSETGGGVTALPNTGAGTGGQNGGGSAWLFGAAAVGGIAAVGASRLRASRAETN